MTDIFEDRQSRQQRVRNELKRGPLRAAYALSHVARTAWYAGHYIAAQRLSPPLDGPPAQGIPGWGAILADLQDLYARDLANIEAGLYKLPQDMVPRPARMLRQSQRFFRELPGVTQRRRHRLNSEVFTEDRKQNYPRYYLQNFHYQRDGWLSDESAEAYDHQVEVLFTGGADAMRRQALPYLHKEVTRLSTNGMAPRVLDLATGTGRFLRDVKRAFPQIQLTALDLSANYLKKAEHILRRWKDTSFVEAKAEETGLGDDQFELITCVYLFHELPKKIRRDVAAEAYRVLKPGGLMVFVDSIQTGDHPQYDDLLHRFPLAFHEPYYENYIADDLDGVFKAAGFEIEAIERAFFSRVMALRKPA